MSLPVPAPIHRLGAWVLNRDDARAKHRRRRWLSRAAAVTPVVMADMEGGRILVRTTDPYVSAAVFANGRYDDMTELDTAVRVLREHGRADKISGGQFIDVGANIGTATVSAMLRHDFGSAVAIEPEPVNAALLRANVALNALDARVAVIEAAAGDADGSIGLLVNEANPGDHRVSAVSSPEPGSRAIDVPVRSLDSLVASGDIAADDVGLLWIDVQGFEPAVLRGATSLIEAGVPAVLEYAPGHVSDQLVELQRLIAESFDQIGDLREGRGGRPVHLRPASEIGSVQPAGSFTDLLLIPR